MFCVELILLYLFIILFNFELFINIPTPSKTVLTPSMLEYSWYLLNVIQRIIWKKTHNRGTPLVLFYNR